MTEAEIAGASAQELVKTAKRLGLVWTIRPATVKNANPLTIIYDGDTVPIGAVSIIGDMAIGLRVYGFNVPPSGNFITGIVGGVSSQALAPAVNFNGSAGTGTTTSVSYANTPGAETVTLLKAHGFETNILVSLEISSFSSLASTGSRFAVLINGVDHELANLFHNLANTHMHCSGTKLIVNQFAGSTAIVARWRRTSGLGTVSQNGDDWVALTAEEVPA